MLVLAQDGKQHKRKVDPYFGHWGEWHLLGLAEHLLNALD